MIARLASAVVLFAGCLSPGCETSPRRSDVHGATSPAAQTAAQTAAQPAAQPASQPPRCSMSHPDTIAILTRHDLSGLSSSRGRGRQELAAIPNVTDHLLAIARAGDCDTDLRFRAFESYFALSGAAAATPGDSDALAQVYVATIAAQAYANRWGLPSSVKSSATSRRLIAAGPAAKRELAALLDDARGMPYEGSEDATIAAEHRLRVKDLAGALIAAIVGASFPDDPDPAARDAVITALRAKL